MKIKKFLYLHKETGKSLMIPAKRRPSLETEPRSGTWVVYEYYEDGWYIPNFPEIMWWTINKKLIYVGILEGNWK